MLLGLQRPRTAHAQIWHKTARITTPIQIGGPMEALLDTLLHTLERREGALVQRRPGGAKQGVPELQDALVDEYGIGVVTANTLGIDYRFEVGAVGTARTRRNGASRSPWAGSFPEEIPLLYIDARQEWVQKLLNNKGTDLPGNEAALIPFRRYLNVVWLARLPDTQLIRIDGEMVREGGSLKKEALIREILYLAYDLE